jgi:two-component system phosphate regulon sensor histidine kinase PhoR
VYIQGSAQQVQLTVKDRGIGIAEEYHGKIFEKFFRVPTGNLHNAKGYGLGLSYVAHVVRKHKGEIRVASQQGQGSSFIVSLPKHLV